MKRASAKTTNKITYFTIYFPLFCTPDDSNIVLDALQPVCWFIHVVRYFAIHHSLFTIIASVSHTAKFAKETIIIIVCT